MIDKDLRGNVILQNPKDSKSAEIEGQGRFCGHRFLLKTKLYGDKRCIYCGRWFHWQDSDYHRWIREGNIDPYNADNNVEPLHCGNLHCSDYHHLCAVAKEKKAVEAEEINEEKTFELYKNLKKRGIL